MSKNYSVTILPRAERDIDAIFSWLANRSPLGARNWLTALDAAVHRMTTDPHSFGSALEIEGLDATLKQCLFKTPKGRAYTAIYLIENESVIVLRVRGPGQPPLQTDEIDFL